PATPRKPVEPPGNIRPDALAGPAGDSELGLDLRGRHSSSFARRGENEASAAPDTPSGFRRRPGNGAQLNLPNALGVSRTRRCGNRPRLRPGYPCNRTKESNS